MIENEPNENLMNGKGEWGQNHVPRMKLTEPSLPELLPKPNVHLPDTAKRKTDYCDQEGLLNNAFHNQFARRIKRARIAKKASTELQEIQTTNA